MATTAESKTESARDSSTSSSTPPRPVYRSGSGGRIVGFLILIGVLGGGGYLLATQVSSFGGDEETGKDQTHTVQKEALQIVVIEDGNVESAQNVDVKCQVPGGTSILWIVEDGTIVKKGDKLVELDEYNIEEQLNSQKIVFENARATLIQAEEDHGAAVIAVNEYEKGTFLKEQQDALAQITVAKQNLSTAQNALDHTERMVQKGFATPLQLQAEQFGLERANLDLKSAELAKEVLEKYTFRKTLKQLVATREANSARKDSEAAALELEENKLKRLKNQLKHCIITAPQGGMVVYANDNSRRFGQSQPQIEEGAMLRDGQSVIKIPDLTNMQVKVTVHESKVKQLKPGMPARIEIQEQVMRGNVASVANQPEQGSWFSANVKEFATIVKIAGGSTDLKPGMTANVEILVDNLVDVLTVPVSSVVEQRGKFYAWVQTPNGHEKRPLILGQTNDKMIEIQDGLKEGDKVLLNPRAHVPEAREEGTAEEEETEKKFGSESKSKSDSENSASKEQSAASAEKQEEKSETETAESGDTTATSDEASAQSSGSAEAQPRGEGRREGGGRRRGNFNLMQFDKDGDGKVSKDEAPERMRNFFDRMDPNGDGYIDAKEIADMQRRFSQGGGGGGGRPGDGGSGGGRPQ